MKLILTYWFGDVSFDLASGQATDPKTGAPLAPGKSTLFQLLRPRGISLDTGVPGLGSVGLAGANSILDTIGQDPLSGA